MDLTPRAVIAGRYRVDTKVGAGGMGEVWLGEHIAVGVRVAVKTLLPAAAMNHEVVARFKREAYILGRIRSDHVARVVDFVADDLYGLVLVMEFVEGDPLSRLLQERTLTIEEGIDLAFGLTGALKDLHGASIIHRDLKPGNVMMQPMPDGRRRAVVVDFGVSRLMNDKDTDEDEELTGITRADMAVGTIEYMAPEQILNSRNVAPGSDIYAAGAMLFRACAGRHVFGSVQSDTELAQKKLTTEAPPLPLQRTDAIAEGFAKVVARMVKRRPSERYKTADEVLQDLLPLKSVPRETDGDAGATLAIKGAHTAVLAAKAASAQAAVAAVPATQVSAPPPAPASPAVSAQAPHSAAPPARAESPSVPSGAFDSSRASRTSGVVAAPTSAPRVSANPPRKGVPIAVTLGLVAFALAGGVFLGPRLLAPNGFELSPVPSGPASSPPAPSATAEAHSSGAGGAHAASPTATAAVLLPADADAGTDASAAPGTESVLVDAGPRDAGPARRFDGGAGYRGFDAGLPFSGVRLPNPGDLL